MKISIATASLVASATMAAEFHFINKCDKTINLFADGKNHVCDIKSSETKTGNCGATLVKDTKGIFRHTSENNVNLLEYSLINAPGSGLNQVWYDVSNIPPGPDECTSYDDCKAHTGTTGFNVPILVHPTKHNNGKNCRDLLVTAPDSPQAFLFPKDNDKVADCPMDEVFEVTYCPNGNVTPAPTTAAPAQTTAAPAQPTAAPAQTTAKPSLRAGSATTSEAKAESTSVAHGSGVQFDPCTTNEDCSSEFTCTKTTDKTFSMCQPTPAKWSGASEQFKPCDDKNPCSSGYHCKPTTDGEFSMCQPDAPAGGPAGAAASISSEAHPVASPPTQQKQAEAAPVTTTPPPQAPANQAPAPQAPAPAPEATPAPTSAPQPNSGGSPKDNGSGLWGGKVSIVNNLDPTCDSKSATWFGPNSARGDLTKGASIGLGPFTGSYTLGVQENVFANCAEAGDCAWNNGAADQYCFNFSLQKDCSVKYNDCPWPAGKNGKPSPAPDGRKRYSITGEIQGDTCVLSVNPTGSGEYFCHAKLG